MFAVMIMLCASVYGVPAHALTPNDPLLSQQWYLSKIHAFDAWDTQTGSREVVVAVLDTGVDFDHPDLAGNLWTNENEIPGDGIDNDNNGFIDDTNGWDFVDDDNSPIPTVTTSADIDAVYHGTVVAGLIGAVGNNAEGVTGVSWNVRIMPVRILDQFGSGTSQSARLALEYAVENGADIVNFSFTGFALDGAFRDVVRRAYERGVTVVAAAGNKGGGGTNLEESPVYPACFHGDTLEEDWVIGVSSTNENDEKAAFSNYGASCVDIAAPGVDVFGTVYQDSRFNELKDAYAGGWSGTSVSSPLVAGAAALLKSSYPSLTPMQIKTALQLSADPIAKTSVASGSIGSGRIHVQRALQVAGALASGPAVIAPPSPTEQRLLGEARVVLGASTGEPPMVSVFTDHGVETHSFLAYAASFTGGVRVAVGDVTGDGVADIITTPGPGGGPHVRIFSLAGELEAQFFAGDTSDRHGLTVAVADVDGDHTDEIVIAPEAGGSGVVTVFRANGSTVSSFTPFVGSRVSLSLAGIDQDGDGIEDIAIARGMGAPPEVRVYRADGVMQSQVTAYADTFDRGVHVTAGKLVGGEADTLIVGTGIGGGPQVRAFAPNGSVSASFFAFGTEERDGVLVAASHLSSGSSTIVAYNNGRLSFFDRSGGLLSKALIHGSWGAIAATK